MTIIERIAKAHGGDAAAKVDGERRFVLAVRLPRTIDGDG
jgi:hypothetical protein